MYKIFPSRQKSYRTPNNKKVQVITTVHHVIQDNCVCLANIFNSISFRILIVCAGILHAGFYIWMGLFNTHTLAAAPFPPSSSRMVPCEVQGLSFRKENWQAPICMQKHFVHPCGLDWIPAIVFSNITNRLQKASQPQKAKKQCCEEIYSRCNI